MRVTVSIPSLPNVPRPGRAGEPSFGEVVAFLSGVLPELDFHLIEYAADGQVIGDLSINRNKPRVLEGLAPVDEPTPGQGRPTEPSPLTKQPLLAMEFSVQAENAQEAEKLATGIVGGVLTRLGLAAEHSPLVLGVSE